MLAARLIRYTAIAVISTCFVYLAGTVSAQDSVDSPELPRPETLLAVDEVDSDESSAGVAETVDMTADEIAALKATVLAAFGDVHEGFSSDEVVLDDELFSAFVKACEETAPEVEPWRFGWTLMNLRKAGGLSDVETTQRRTTNVTRVLHIAEIASRSLQDELQISTDRIMVDPELRQRFDEIARTVVEDVDLYAVRKAAFRLRKSRRLRPELITRIADWGRTVKSYPAKEIAETLDEVSEDPGIYIFRDASGYLYIGETGNLRRRLTQHLDESSSLSLATYLETHGVKDLTIELHQFDPDSRIREVSVRRAYEAELIQSRQPKFNLNAR